jgi:hypothetical protein
MDQKVDYQKIKEKTAKATQTSPVIQGLHQNVELSAGSLQFWQTTKEAGSSSQPGIAEKSTGGRYSTAVRNLPIKVTSQTASSGTPSQGASVLANLWREVTYT